MKLTMTLFLTFDGVYQGPGGPDEDRSGGFDRGGWVFPYVDDDFGRYVSEWFGEADAFLLGRRTYEIFAAFWPGVTDADDPVAGPLNRLPKFVASTTLGTVQWEHAELLQGDPAEAVRRLKQQPGRDLQVHGSGALAGFLHEHGLIDEYRFFTFPVVLGRGKRLFPEGAAPAALELLDTKQTSAGVTVQTYRPAGELRFGTIGG